MKIEITRYVKRTETVDVDLPFYYKHDTGEDYESIVLGKVDEGRVTSITIRSYVRGQRIFELETDERWKDTIASYFKDEYRSSEADFLDAKKAMLEAVENA